MLDLFWLGQVTETLCPHIQLCLQSMKDIEGKKKKAKANILLEKRISSK